MKHRKMVNVGSKTVQQILYYQGIQYKKYLSVHSGISETFRKSPGAQTLHVLVIYRIISSVMLISSRVEMGKEGRQIYQACIRTYE